jgi:hypothetical protein
VVWIVFMSLFSLYNLLPIVSAPTISPSIAQDPKILTYNFTMNQPSLVRDNFTTHVTLESNPGFYNIRAFVSDWFYLQSYSAIGEYQINYTIYINGVNALLSDGLTANFGIAWMHENYLLGSQGPLPDLPVQENMTNLHTGDNVVEFRFVQFSKLSQYGSGYYYLKLGPFNVNVSAKPASTLGPLGLEVFVGILLIPASHLVSLTSYRVERKRQGPGRVPILPNSSALDL